MQEMMMIRLQGSWCFVHNRLFIDFSCEDWVDGGGLEVQGQQWKGRGRE